MRELPPVPLWAAMLTVYAVCAAGNLAIGQLGAGWPWMVGMDAVIGIIYGWASR